MRQSNDMLGFGSGHVQVKHTVSKGSVLRTLAFIASFGLGGCTGFVWDFTLRLSQGDHSALPTMGALVGKTVCQ